MLITSVSTTVVQYPVPLDTMRTNMPTRLNSRAFQLWDALSLLLFAFYYVEGFLAGPLSKHCSLHPQLGDRDCRGFPPDHAFLIRLSITTANTEVAESSAIRGNEQPTLPPGEVENSKFVCDDSVYFWRTFDSRGNRGNLEMARDLLLQNTLRSLSSHQNPSAVRASYWSSQLLRMAYFSLAAALGTVGSDMYEGFVVANDSKRERNTNTNSNATNFLDRNGPGMATNLLSSDVPSRLIFEALKVFEQDYQWVDSGLLNFAWDSIAAPATTRNSNIKDKNQQQPQIRIQWDHRQMNPLFAAQEIGRVVRESIGIFGRRNKYSGRLSDEQFGLTNRLRNSASSSNLESTVVQYPEYYLNDFHYQTDGWLSFESARNYEATTETLFTGRQDAMQRQTLIPMLKHFQRHKQQPSSALSQLNILEVGAGTGRFATFLRDNFPHSKVTLTDLSPFYLEKARENDDYWRNYRGAKLMNNDVVPNPSTLVQANAEELPFPNDTFDAVVCVYLFHELPRQAQENAVREMARVLKPGGIISLTDSIQQGDRPPLDALIGAFARLNEPHYDAYSQMELAPHFEKHGLVCGEKYVASSTKTLSFTKPLVEA